MANAYKTSDIHVAATLLALGHEFLGSSTDPERRDKVIFSFYGTLDLNDDVLAYMNDTVKLPPRVLFSRLRELKGLVYNSDRS